MEDNISNPLRFETNPYHNVIIKDRKVMEMCIRDRYRGCHAAVYR